MLKTNKVTIRFADDELSNIKFKAQKYNITISEYIRRVAIDNYLDDILKKDYYQVKLYQINKIGNNLNQIAHNLNTTRTLDTMVLQKLIDIEKLLNSL